MNEIHFTPCGNDQYKGVWVSMFLTGDLSLEARWTEELETGRTWLVFGCNTGTGYEPFRHTFEPELRRSIEQQASFNHSWEFLDHLYPMEADEFLKATSLAFREAS